MKCVVLLSSVLALWTNIATADAGIKYPVLAVTSQSPRALTPWIGPGPADTRVIFVEEMSPSNYFFFVCSDLEGKDCTQLNESPVRAADLTTLVSSGIGLNRWDLPIMVDLEWGFALPDTRSFLRMAGSQFLTVLQAGGRGEMMAIRTGGATNAEILAKQLVYYSGAALKN